MRHTAETTAFVSEVSDLYADIMGRLEGASTDAIRAALSMAVVMSGENIGLRGTALLDWIDETGEDAKLALSARRRRLPAGRKSLRRHHDRPHPAWHGRRHRCRRTGR